MNIGGAEFVAALDDAMEALDKNGIAQREKEEVLFFLYGPKNEVMKRCPTRQTSLRLGFIAKPDEQQAEKHERCHGE